jgi:hypothetical protein
MSQVTNYVPENTMTAIQTTGRLSSQLPIDTSPGLGQ